MRFERKFIIPYSKKNLLDYFLKNHPLNIKTLFDSRIINNIYFDNINFKFFKDNIDGISDRIKIRARWYGQTFGRIKNPKLEFKIKQNTLGEKKFYEMDDFFFDEKNGIDEKNLIKKIRSKNIKDYINVNFIRPKILNVYNRKYFITNDQYFRITLDSFPRYYDLEKKKNYLRSVNHFEKYHILEVKYNKEYDKYFQFFIKYLPLRLDKNSKYVFGVNKILENKII
ncbi:VTC domain-containing protein [Candidatus Pelagibacter sp. HIMB1509]|uniref:VTC domain-containing protein n=1 Tax=Candidatus Pelagibacter sp. HIMB1509 TaxID=3413339 RepID=UPI003F8328CF